MSYSKLPAKSIPVLLQPRRGETIVACPHAAAGPVNWFVYDPPMQVTRQFGKTVFSRRVRFFAVCDPCLVSAGDPLQAATEVLQATGEEQIRVGADPRSKVPPFAGLVAAGAPDAGDVPERLQRLLEDPERPC